MKYKITKIRENRRIREGKESERVITVKFQTDNGYKGALDFPVTLFDAEDAKKEIEKHIIEVMKISKKEGEI